MVMSVAGESQMRPAENLPQAAWTETDVDTELFNLQSRTRVGCVD